MSFSASIVQFVRVACLASWPPRHTGWPVGAGGWHGRDVPHSQGHYRVSVATLTIKMRFPACSTDVIKLCVSCNNIGRIDFWSRIKQLDYRTVWSCRLCQLHTRVKTAVLCKLIVSSYVAEPRFCYISVQWVRTISTAYVAMSKLLL